MVSPLEWRSFGAPGQACVTQERVSNGFWWARIVLVPDTESGLLIAANVGPDAGADQASDEMVIVPMLARQ